MPQIIQPTPQKPQPNVIRLQVVRPEGAGLVCPHMTSVIPMDLAEGPVMGGRPRIVMQAVPVYCLGADCQVWDPTRGQAGDCGHKVRS